MIWCAVLGALFTILVAEQQDVAASKPKQSLQDIVRQLTRATKAQEKELGVYSVNRRYSVRWKGRKDVDVLEVLWSYKPGAGKEFKVIKTEGSSSFTQKALREVVETEARNSHLEPDPASVTPDHYLFALTNADEKNFRLKLTPRNASKFLVKGDILVDRKSGSLIRLEGKTSKRLSFWVSSAYLVRQYARTGEFWLPAKTQSIAHVRFLGEVELTIDSENYRFASL